MQISTDWNLLQLQKFFRELYGRVNRRYTPVEMIMKAVRYATLGEKIGLKDEIKMRNMVVMTGAWTIGAANKLGVVLSNQIAHKYPMVCHNCGGRPCHCGPVKPTGVELPRPSLEMFDASIDRMQGIFASIYPNNTYADSMKHLSHEVPEVGDALTAFGQTGQATLLTNAGGEFADVFAHSFAVANTADFRLIHEYQRMFRQGCPGCYQFPCRDCMPQLVELTVNSVVMA